jgi:hypothetical protein
MLCLDVIFPIEVKWRLPLVRFRVFPSLDQLIIVGWITWDRAGLLGGKWRPLVRKVGECDVESRHLQGCSPHLCRLRTDGLAPASKWCSYVTTWSKPLSPTPRLSWGRGNEVTQYDGRVSLSLVIKISLGCRGVFRPRGD